MKKFLVLFSAILMTLSSAQATEPVNSVKIDVAVQNARMQQAKTHRDMAFERRLELTEVQKLKAREIRKSGHEKLKPVIEEIRNKKQEAEMIRRSRMAVQMQEEKLAVIDAELKILEKKANQIRRENMKEFESILTRSQKNTLKNMKKEGRKKYQSAHPVKPVFPVKR